MTLSDALRFGAAIVVLLAWLGLVVGLYGDPDALNTATPVAFAAATFLFATPLFDARRKRTRADDDD